MRRTADGSGGGGVIDIGIVNGRLTLETGVPVSTSDQSAKTTVYFTPFKGNRIALYSGGEWDLLTFTEKSLSLSGYTASKPYDIFAYDSSGTVTLESLVWTDGTTRATALAMQDGVYVKSGDATRRYIGTIYINSSGGQTEDTELARFVWNYYNQVSKKLNVKDETSHVYNNTSPRAWNNDTTIRVQLMTGVAENSLDLSLWGEIFTNNTNWRGIYITKDGTGYGPTQARAPIHDATMNNTSFGGGKTYNWGQLLGFHYFQVVEVCGASTTFERCGISGGFDC